jgi:hypothetical protein
MIFFALTIEAVAFFSLTKMQIAKNYIRQLAESLNA